MQVRIVGAGSLGMLFAGKIGSVANSVELITHSLSQSKKIGREGLTLQTGSQIQTIPLMSFPFFDFPIQIERQPIDWLFLMVKQKDITDAFIQQLLEWVNDDTRVVCFQNGIGHKELLSPYFPANRLYAAVTTEAARKQADNVVEHTGQGITRIGKMEEHNQDIETYDENEIKLQQLLKKAGFEANLSKKMNSLIWNKLLLNTVINPLTAIFRMPNGELLTSPDLLKLMQVLLQEGLNVAAYEGIQTADHLWEQLLQVCEKTARNESSMLQDVKAGRRTEIDWLNGALINAAEKHQLSLPAHQALYWMVRHLESR